jgi:heme exporter protein A
LISKGNPVLVEVEGLVRRFGRHMVLDGIDFQVKPGEWVVVAGANGAGKTTLLRILAGILSFQSGRVKIDGHDLEDSALEARMQIGSVLHHSLLYGDLTAEENLQFFSGLYGIADPQPAIKKYLELLGLDKHIHQQVKTFSHGMKQKLNIVRALLHDPKVLLLDEPTSNIDTETIVIIHALLKQLTNDGKALIMATHDVPSVKKSLTRILTLENGKLKSTRKVIHIAQQDSPRHRRTL